ncbi:putative peptide chain release factor 1 [Anaerococcus hydrogenalis DSM 7454]|uniref:Putative peptide chain release factor 1 n=1 Tax=Anaerococcus hydrogenalis DSM 7454 TaxID=561177 RepID=B6WAG9_9FIRM|nr:putative peptide chain release factor 1 [Anaerococcus hydrogenalis DSM 7454]
MLENLEHMRENFKELEKKLADPEVLSDTDKFKKVSREYNQLKPIVEKYNEIRAAEDMIEENTELLKEAEDKEMIDLLKAEIDENKKI